MIRLTRQQRYFLVALVVLMLWGVIFTVWQNLQPGSGTRGTAEALQAQAQPISVFDAVVVGDTSALSGSLVFVEQRAQPYYRIAQLDFGSQKAHLIHTAFNIPPDALVYQVAKTGNSDRLLLTYSAPPATGQIAYDRNGIYELNLKDGTLSRLLGADKANVYYFYPQRANNIVYYVIYEAGTGTRRIEGYDLVNQAVTLVANSATVPTVSPDGASIAYLHINPTTQVCSLWLKTLTGGNPVQLVSEGIFPDIDMPMFSPDGAWIYFAVLEAPPVQTKLSVFDVWLGASPVAAHGNHNLPSRWFRVSAAGGNAEPVTAEPVITLAGDSDHDALGFVSQTGFYVVRDHTVKQIVRSRAMGSFAWLP